MLSLCFLELSVGVVKSLPFFYQYILLRVTEDGLSPEHA